MPFDVRRRDGVLTLTLDTPGAPVNIFNHATAHQLVEILGGVSPADTRAIVVATAKPNSFVNGVGLLLAHASQNHEDVVRAATPPWTAYRAVRNAPVPTIAAVQGNCFGCGVELALSCDYRVACDTAETQFYMTELNDYLFLPLFGATWNLPATVGLEAAIDMLLWGERWNARRARDGGLVDAVAEPDEFPGCVERFVAGMAGRPRQRRGPIEWSSEDDRAVERARRRIARLPPAYRTVYGDGLDLLVSGGRQLGSYDEHQKHELERSSASALAPIGKAAYAFFYLRQIAGERAAGRAVRSAASLSPSIELREPATASFAAELGAARLGDVSLTAGRTPDLRLFDASDRRSSADVPVTDVEPPDAGGVAVRTGFALTPVSPVELYLPGYARGSRLAELAVSTRTEGCADDVRLLALARTLQRLGFAVVRTTPRRTFASTRLLLGFVSPLVRAIERGVDPAQPLAALRRLGFVREPLALVDPDEHAALAIPLAGEMGCAAAGVESILGRIAGVELDEAVIGGGEPDAADSPCAGFVAALCLSLLGAVVELREDGAMRDAPCVDLMAREWIDFPRHLVSLCSWLTPKRVAGASANVTARELVGTADVEAARRFLDRGRSFYR